MSRDQQQINLVLAHHYHRMLAAGVPVDDWEDAHRNPPATWRAWLDQWCARGDRYVRCAEEAAARGHLFTAGQHYTAGALSYHYAQFMAYTVPDLKLTAATKSAAAFKSAAPNLVPPRVPIDAVHTGISLSAFLRVPDHCDSPVGVVTIVPGLEATKVEMSGWEPCFLDRGVATMVLDGPGQGELSHIALDPRSYAAAISAVVTKLVSRPEIDDQRLVIMGPSLGGLLATTTAALDGRFAAVVEVGGTFDTLSRWSRANELSKAGHQSITHSASLQETEEKITTWTVAGLADRITAPFLIVHGERDNVVPLDQAERYHKAIPHSKLIVVPGGNHACNNIAHVVRPTIADWVIDQLGDVS